MSMKKKKVVAEEGERPSASAGEAGDAKEGEKSPVL